MDPTDLRVAPSLGASNLLGDAASLAISVVLKVPNPVTIAAMREAEEILKIHNVRFLDGVR